MPIDLDMTLVTLESAGTQRKAGSGTGGGVGVEFCPSLPGVRTGTFDAHKGSCLLIESGTRFPTSCNRHKMLLDLQVRVDRNIGNRIPAPRHKEYTGCGRTLYTHHICRSSLDKRKRADLKAMLFMVHDQQQLERNNSLMLKLSPLGHLPDSSVL
ncbi:hypothetical protein M422DRAFT_43697 [Sphaerobolus stellatus SS14]|nr:hypothetical protein M422DRAFT_43697 [Sphaerobolus stellatus SS14]